MVIPEWESWWVHKSWYAYRIQGLTWAQNYTCKHEIQTTKCHGQRKHPSWNGQVLEWSRLWQFLGCFQMEFKDRPCNRKVELKRRSLSLSLSLLISHGQLFVSTAYCRDIQNWCGWLWPWLWDDCEYTQNMHQIEMSHRFHINGGQSDHRGWHTPEDLPLKKP